MRHSGVLRAVVVLALVASLDGCGGGTDAGSGGPVAPKVASVTLAASGATTILAGSTLQLTAVVADQSGAPVAGQVVTYASSAQDVASVSSTGLVTALGPVGAASISASAGGITSAPVAITVVPAAPRSIEATRGQSQIGKLVGTAADPLGVRVTDAYGNGVGGVQVSWSASSGGSLANATTVTDGAGATTNNVVLGPAPGTVTVSASISAGSTASFTIASASATLTALAGDGQTGVIGLPLGDSLTVREIDVAGAPVAGSSVSWRSGGTTVTSVTDANGVTRIPFVPTAASTVVTAEDARFGAAPVTFTVAASPPVACDLRAPDVSGLHWENEGPTDYSIFARPEGTVKAVMIFVDFSDAQATQPTSTYSDAIIPYAVDYFREASYGRMALSVTPVPKWYRLPQPSSAYHIQRAAGTTFEVQRTYMAAAIALADPDVDFSQYSHVYIVASKGSQVDYSPGFIAFPGAGIVADGREMRHGATLGTDLWNASPQPHFAANIFAHETGHTFGLPDLYTFQPVSDYYDLYRWAGGWDVMRWNATGGHFYAWHKYKLGWIHADEMACIGHGRAELVLSPTEASGGMKLAMVKLDDAHAIVAEVRQAVGHDAFARDQGVLLYRVDATSPTGGTAAGGPIVLLPSRVGSDLTAIHSVGPYYNATYGLEPGKVGSFTDATSGVTMTIKSVASGAYRLVIGRP